MLEIIKIIVRIVCGFMPIVWGISYWAFLIHNKLEKLCAILSLVFICFGMADCIATAIGF